MDEHTPASRNRRPDIQGLRAVAVLVVVAFHAGLPVPGGFVGVDIFFVVSGFVITAMLHRQWQRSGRIGFGDFYIRRFKRLTPALALMISVTLVMAALLVSPLGPQQATAQTAIGAMMLVANIVIASTTGGYFDQKAETNPLLHTWSLSVEEQFYLIFPALLVLGWFLARTRRRFLGLSPLVIVACIGAVSFALAVASSYGLRSVPGFNRLFGFYSPLNRVWEFAAGALLALLLERWGPPRGSAGPLGIAGLAGVTASVLLITERTPFPGVWTLLPVIGTMLILVSGGSAEGPAYRTLSAPWMVKIGDWSYSIYLWHWPFIVAAGLAWSRAVPVLSAAALVSLVPAIVSYRWVEEPVRNLVGFPPRRWAGLVAVVLTVPLALASALWFGASSGWWSKPVRQLQVATIPLHAATVARCDKRKPLSPDLAAHCTWNGSQAGAPIYLVGDSNSVQFSEGVIEAGKDLSRPVVIASGVACPFADVFISTQPASDTAVCRRYFQATLDYLKQADRGVVMIANIDTYWSEDVVEAGTSMDELSAEPTRKIEALRMGLRRTVESLRSAGHRVLLVQTIPHLEWDPGRCGLLTIMGQRCRTQATVGSAIEYGLAARAVLTDVAGATGAALWDPVSPLCPDGMCSTQAPTFVRYRDAAHISVRQSIALAPEIRTALLAAGE